MKKLVRVAIIFFLFISTGFTQIPTANVIPDPNIELVRKGDIINLSGTGFEPGDEIRLVSLTLIGDGNRLLGEQFVKDYNLNVNSKGVLSGYLVIPDIPLNVSKVEILIYAEKTNVKGSRFLAAIGNSKRLVPKENTIQAAGTVTIDDNPGNNIAENNENLNLSGAGWTGSLKGLAQREYSDVSGTVYITSTSLSTANASIDGSGNLSGFATTTSSYNASTKSIRIRVGNNALEFTDSNVMLTPDATPPNLISATATSLTIIRLVFDEAVQEVGSDAAVTFDLTGTTVTGTSLDPVGSAPTDTWDLTLSGNLPDRAASGVTIAYDSTKSTTVTLEDAAGNEVANTSPAINVSDAIPPATPVLTKPVNTDIFSPDVILEATAESGTQDPSMSGVNFQGSNDGSTWTTVGTDNDVSDGTYTFTYTPGTKYSYYRAQAVDNGGAVANSSSSPNFTDAHRIKITTFPSTLDPGVRGQFTITIQNNYTDAVAFGSNLAFNLSSDQTTGTFYDAISGGSQITQVVITSGNTTADFWYMDTNDGTTPTITVTESASNLDDPTDAQQITINAVSVDHFAVKTGNNESETAGVSFNVTVEAHNASDSIVTTYVGDHTLTWQTNATASPKGNSPVVPSNGTYTFSSGVVTVANGATFYNSAETPYIRVTDENNTATSTTENAGQSVTVADGPAAEIRIKTQDETADGNYNNNVLGTMTVQGPTQADPDVTVDVFAVVYDAYGNLLPDEAGSWGKPGLDGSYALSGNQTSNTFVFSAGSQAGTVYTGNLTFKGATSSLSAQTGTITVDDNDGATVTGFTITTDNDDNRFVFAAWNGTSSGDDDGTGTPSDYEIRWAPESSGPIDTDAKWNAATSVGNGGKPSFSTGLWRIDMSGFPSGNKYFAIRTFDDVGNISVLGSGAYTTNVDFSLPVTISVFKAIGDYGKIIIEWETSSEINNEGFFIYRSTQEDGEFIQINPQIIPGRGNSNQTNKYSFIDKDVDPEVTYYYKLFSRDFGGEINEYEYIVSAKALPIPKSFSLEPNYPNPFNPSTRFKFTIAQRAQASLIIYDVLGKKVRTIFQNKSFEPGVYTNYIWDAKDDFGNDVSNGIYYSVFIVPDYSFKQVRKMVYIR